MDRMTRKEFLEKAATLPFLPSLQKLSEQLDTTLGQELIDADTKELTDPLDVNIGVEFDLDSSYQKRSIYYAFMLMQALNSEQEIKDPIDFANKVEAFLNDKGFWDITSQGDWEIARKNILNIAGRQDLADNDGNPENISCHLAQICLGSARRLLDHLPIPITTDKNALELAKKLLNSETGQYQSGGFVQRFQNDWALVKDLLPGDTIALRYNDGLSIESGHVASILAKTHDEKTGKIKVLVFHANRVVLDNGKTVTDGKVRISWMDQDEFDNQLSRNRGRMAVLRDEEHYQLGTELNLALLYWNNLFPFEHIETSTKFRLGPNRLKDRQKFISANLADILTTIFHYLNLPLNERLLKLQSALEKINSNNRGVLIEAIERYIGQRKEPLEVHEIPVIADKHLPQFIGAGLTLLRFNFGVGYETTNNYELGAVPETYFGASPIDLLFRIKEVLENKRRYSTLYYDGKPAIYFSTDAGYDGFIGRRIRENDEYQPLTGDIIVHRPPNSQKTSIYFIDTHHELGQSSELEENFALISPDWKGTGVTKVHKFRNGKDIRDFNKQQEGAIFLFRSEAADNMLFLAKKKKEIMLPSSEIPPEYLFGNNSIHLKFAQLPKFSKIQLRIQNAKTMEELVNAILEGIALMGVETTDRANLTLPGSRWFERDDGLPLCNLYSTDLARLILNDSDISHRVNNQGVPLFSGGEELTAEGMNTWLTKHGQNYGWIPVTNLSYKEKLRLLEQGHIFYYARDSKGFGDTAVIVPVINPHTGRVIPVLSKASIHRLLTHPYRPDHIIKSDYKDGPPLTGNCLWAHRIQKTPKMQDPQQKDRHPKIPLK